MSKIDERQERSIDEEPHDFDFSEMMRIEEAEGTIETTHARASLPDLLDAQLQLGISAENLIHIYVDAEPELKNGSGMDATLYLSPEQATDLGYQLITYARKAETRDPEKTGQS